MSLQPLDPIYTPLSGVNLIEASAGTGKTYTITALYVRLVVEAALPVRRILVVTYTRAATKELRDRIRTRLSEIRAAFLRGHALDDELATRLLDLQPDREIALRRLHNAVRGFDEAAIYTIHGFCQRALGDNAFESGLTFETELRADISDLLQEIIEDFWRREFYTAPPFLVDYLLEQKYSPDRLRQEIERYLGKPYLQVVTPSSTLDDATLQRDFSAAFEAAKALWQQQRGAIEAALQSPALNRSTYKLNDIPNWLAEMEAYLNGPPSLIVFEKFGHFTTTELRNKTKKNQTTPAHPFFDACETLQTVITALRDYCQHQILARLLDWCNRELASRKRQQQLQSYDDLLLNLNAALQHPQRGAALAHTLQRRYAAALIDEFQDTDPVQYAIFQRIYAGTAQPLFLVGDPKQAIYSFRGADIFAYLAARRATGQRYTLDVNWRSDPRLLTALNALFGAAGAQPFLFDGIPFQPAIPAAQKQHQPLIVQGRQEAPLWLWLLENEGSQPADKTRSNEQVARATAAEIARLLNLGARGQARIGARPLAGGDIAVLVRSHRQGRLLRRELLRLGVPSVQHADDNVFSADEARQLQWLLAAVLEPGDEGQVRAALASDLFGLSGTELHRLREDEQGWAAWLERFQDYQRIWREHGFMRFFRAWLMEAAVPQRLLAFRDGERRLTNLLHLAELLHLASCARPGRVGLLKWLVERCHDPARQDEAQQLRLESDENLVQIVTVHKSKGLEYPVVFCPFLWDGRLHSTRSNSKSTSVLYHDPADPQRTVLALGAAQNDPAWQHARREEVAENLRLCYVALTRAQQRCYLVWGKVKDAETAPPAWLLHQPTVIGPDVEPLDAVAKHFQALDGSGLRGELHAVFAPVADTVALLPLPHALGPRYQPPVLAEPEWRARPFTRALLEFWRVGSFTALTAGYSVAAEVPDHDLSVAPPALESAAPALPVDTAETVVPALELPRGARSGIFLHKLLEQIDFTQAANAAYLESRVSRKLESHGLDAAQWTPVVVALLQRVLATPLDASGLRLQDIGSRQRLNELEFTYPLAWLRAETLRALLARHGCMAGPFRERLERLEFSPLHGYMKGFIDLVFEANGRFYLVDYKSNWLGATPAAYRREDLEAAMAREAYRLQYLIYTVALHRYLRVRVADYAYEKHFGGVFYLFLRGMDPATGPQCGVFHDCPTPALIAALDQLMATGEVAKSTS